MNTIYDLEFDKIEDLKWYPFIGTNYKDVEKKILLIGESHYIDMNNKNENIYKKEYTRWNVKELGMGIRDYIDKTKFYRNINRMFVNNNQIEFWNKVSFYDFIQTPMTKVGNTISRPNKIEFLKGWEVFEKVIEVIKPEVCLFFGTSSADYFNEFCSNYNIDYDKVIWKEKVGGAYFKKGALVKESQRIELIFIKHPSSKFFSIGKWQKVIENENKNLVDFLNT